MKSTIFLILLALLSSCFNFKQIILKETPADQKYATEFLAGKGFRVLILYRNANNEAASDFKKDFPKEEDSLRNLIGEFTGAAVFSKYINWEKDAPTNKLFLTYNASSWLNFIYFTDGKFSGQIKGFPLAGLRIFLENKLERTS